MHRNAIVTIHDPDEESLYRPMNIVTYGKEVNGENTEELTKRVNKILLESGRETVSVSMVERIQANKADIPLDKAPAFCKAVTEDHPGMEQTYDGLMYEILVNTAPKEMHGLITSPFQKTKDRYRRKLAELRERSKLMLNIPPIYLDTTSGEKLEVIFEEDIDNSVRANFREKGDRRDRKSVFKFDDFLALISGKKIRVRAKPMTPGAPQSIYGIGSKVKGYGEITGLSVGGKEKSE